MGEDWGAHTPQIPLESTSFNRVIYVIKVFENEIVLLNEKPLKLVNSPKQSFIDPIIDAKEGIYAIYDENGLLYVGQSSRLSRRLLSDHRTGNTRGSAFRRSLKDIKGFEIENEISKYVLEHCTFQYIKEENRKRLEHFAIAVLNPRLYK